MIVSALTSIMIGAVLASRYRVLALLPAFVLSSLVGAVAAFATNISLWALAVTLFIVIMGLQCGYVLGVGFWHIRLIIRAYRIRTASFLLARARDIRQVEPP